MGHDQELFIVKLDLIGGILQINSQVTPRVPAMAGNGRLHPLSFPILRALLSAKARETGPHLDDITALYLILLYRRRQVKT